MSQLRRFRLKQNVGRHFFPQNVTVEPGQIVSSRMPLDKIYANKFEEVGEGQLSVAEVMKGGSNLQKALSKLDAATADKIRSAIKSDISGSTEEVVSTEGSIDLPPRADDPEEITPPEDVAEFDEESLGKDVTANYPLAGENGVRIFYRDKSFFVYEEDNLIKQVNKEPLKKNEIKKFIKEYLDLDGE